MYVCMYLYSSNKKKFGRAIDNSYRPTIKRSRKYQQIIDGFRTMYGNTSIKSTQDTNWKGKIRKKKSCKNNCSLLN